MTLEEELEAVERMQAEAVLKAVLKAAVCGGAGDDEDDVFGNNVAVHCADADGDFFHAADFLSMDAADLSLFMDIEDNSRSHSSGDVATKEGVVDDEQIVPLRHIPGAKMATREAPRRRRRVTDVARSASSSTHTSAASPRRRAPKVAVAEEAKTDTYWARRAKNTEAARLNRERKREETRAVYDRLPALEKKKRALVDVVDMLQSELAALKEVARARVATLVERV